MGRGTRKEVKKMISEGAVTVNGIPAADCAMAVDEQNDQVFVRSERVFYRPFVYLMMNKPSGVLSASEDRGGAVTAVDLVAGEYAHYRVSPAGRLDKDSEGFLILTNDGDYIHQVISPAKHVSKRYFCSLEHEISEADIAAFENGILLADGFLCRPAGTLRKRKRLFSRDTGRVFLGEQNVRAESGSGRGRAFVPLYGKQLSDRFRGIPGVSKNADPGIRRNAFYLYRTR